MLAIFKNSLWKNFGASIDMLGNAIAACPEHHWSHNKKFFYIAYHTIVFLDYYLTIPPKIIAALTEESLQQKWVPQKKLYALCIITAQLKNKNTVASI